MMIRYRGIQFFCFLAGITAVLGGGRTFGRYTTRRVDETQSDEYESTVATEMGYYPPTKGGKKDAYYHADYEYVSGQEGYSGHGKGGKRGPGYGKGYGKGYNVSRGSKSGKGGKKGGVPTMSPAPSGSEDFPTTRPPTPVEPSAAPGPPAEFTASPTDEGSFAIELTPYALFYQLEDPRMASRTELEGLTDVTRLYLEEFMMQQFGQTGFTFLDDFVTRRETSTFVDNSYYKVDYESVARFNPFSTILPSRAELDEALEIAFTGENLEEYGRRLEFISVSNVFNGAEASLEEGVVRVGNTSSNAATIAAAAIAATLLAAGIVIYKRRSEENVDGKDLNKAPGDITVAGETFAGETYDGASLENARSYRDEEDGTSGVELLDTINEDVNTSEIPSKMMDVDDLDSVKISNEEQMPQPFDNVALQGLSLNNSEDCTTGVQNRREIGSLLEGDEMSTGGTSSISDISRASRRPRTVAEIEAMLSTDIEEDDDSRSFGSRSKSFSSADGSMSASRRPRTVEEIESLLSGGLDDDSSSD